MALTTALFTGLSGLDVNQSRLAVVGNNIANVNTVAFKSSRALFAPQFYVTDYYRQWIWEVVKDRLKRLVDRQVVQRHHDRRTHLAGAWSMAAP